MSDRYFYKIETPSSKIQEYFLENLSSASWEDYHYFKAWNFPKEVWESEKALSEINKTFKISKAGIISIAADHIYDWHKDEHRGASINMILESDHSHTLFKSRPNKFVVEKIIELKYEPKRFYLFNTQITHCVINFNKPRYLFSCEFEQKKDKLNYIKILNYLKNEKRI